MARRLPRYRRGLHRYPPLCVLGFSQDLQITKRGIQQPTLRFCIIPHRAAVGRICNFMEITFYKNLSAEEFRKSRYKKVKICDTELGTAYWGFAHCGGDGKIITSQINESCIWIQKKEEDIYSAYIVNSIIDTQNKDYLDCIRNVCVSLLNNGIHLN